jgi:hypothetical protein
MLAFLQKLVHNLVQISQTTNHHDSKPSQMRGHRDGLRFHITDHPDPQVRPGKTIQFRFKFIPEIGTLQTMDGTIKFRPVIKSKSRTFRSQMRMVVCAVKHVGNTILTRYTAKKSAHTSISFCNYFSSIFSFAACKAKSNFG